MTLQHNRKTFLTNHKTAFPDLVAYHIYMHVLLALSPKMAPIYKKHIGTSPNHLYFSVVIILVSLYDKKKFHARIRIRRNDSKTFYLNLELKRRKIFLIWLFGFGGLLSHTL